MGGTAAGDAFMQMALELDNALRESARHCRDKAALEQRVAVLENENVHLKLLYLKNQIQVAGAA